MRAFRNFAVAVLAVVALALGGCAASRVLKPEGQAVIKVASVTILPVVVTTKEEGSEEVGKEILAALTKDLTEGGMKVIPGGDVQITIEVAYQKRWVQSIIPIFGHQVTVGAVVKKEGRLLFGVAAAQAGGERFPRSWMAKMVSAKLASDFRENLVTESPAK